MKIWFDTEFIEDGRIIDLMSIGMVREDGETLYLESAECDLSRASQWVKDNVIPHLKGNKHARAEIAKQVVRFVGEKPEFWAYYADYDWVALCQLFGTMMDLPKGWPMYCRDVKQLCDNLGNPKLPEQGKSEHDALADAIWNKAAYEFLTAPSEHPMSEERISGEQFTALGNEISDAIHKAVENGIAIDEAVCIAAAVIADYARGEYGNRYLPALAGVITSRAFHARRHKPKLTG